MTFAHGNPEKVREFCFDYFYENGVAIQPSKSGEFLDGKKLPLISQYSMGITTANFLIRQNDGTKQRPLQNEV